MLQSDLKKLLIAPHELLYYISHILRPLNVMTNYLIKSLLEIQPTTKEINAVTHTALSSILQREQSPYRSLGIPHFFRFSQRDLRVMPSISASCCSLYFPWYWRMKFFV